MPDVKSTGRILGLVFVNTGRCSKSTYKGKAVPLQAWSGPEGFRKLRFPDTDRTQELENNGILLIHNLI
jgi:DNA-binding sugar fermentation-stimulating protein